MNVMPVSRFVMVAIGISSMAGVAGIVGFGSVLTGLGAFVLVMVALQLAYSVQVYLTARTAQRCSSRMPNNERGALEAASCPRRPIPSEPPSCAGADRRH